MLRRDAILMLQRDVVGVLAIISGQLELIIFRVSKDLSPRLGKQAPFKCATN